MTDQSGAETPAHPAAPADDLAARIKAAVRTALGEFLAAEERDGAAARTANKQPPSVDVAAAMTGDTPDPDDGELTAEGWKTTARITGALHHSAEDTVTRVIGLYERWIQTGAPRLGTSIARWWDTRLAELHAALDAAQAGEVQANGEKLELATEKASEPELTAEEARDLAHQLGLDLYRAQDALAFVGECCDIADRRGEPVTTARVREWLQGARCGRTLGGAFDQAREAVAARDDDMGHEERRFRYAAAIFGGNTPDAAAFRQADAVLAVRDRRLEQLTAERDAAERDLLKAQRHNDATCEAVRRRDTAEAALARVADLAEQHPVTVDTALLHATLGQPLASERRATPAETVVRRAENLRDKWLAYPVGDMHHGAGLMLALHLAGEAFGSVDPNEADEPACTARLGPVHCTQPAGHYNPDQHPDPADGDDLGGWHAGPTGPPGPRDHRTLWCDQDPDATPHTGGN